MRLQNIQLPEPEICSEEALYYHRDEKWLKFDGYFNLFYIEKWKTYTDFDSLELHLSLRNCRAVRLMHDETVLLEMNLENTGDAERTGYPGKTEEVQEMVLQVPVSEYQKGVFWFAVKARSQDSCRPPEVSGWYEGESARTWPVRIAAVVCTYKRESYVLRNLKQMAAFLAKPENQDLRLCYWLIDNGRTLTEHDEIRELAKSYPDVIRIIPNSNTGGAGGFTRGMMEAIREKEALGLTHVLLMDDDAVFDPELFVRAYGFLRGRKERWKNIALGGSLWREDVPYIQQASGEWFGNFAVQNDFLLADLRKKETCTALYMCESAHKHPVYSGWWCSCMSLDVVTRDNLPIPLFLHHDDIEYGIRNQAHGIAFLNGIGVWHKGFEQTFPGVNVYYDVRNTLITVALTEPKRRRIDILKWIWKRITALLIEFRYSEMKLAYQAFYDFCRGPEWLHQVHAEKLNQWLREQIQFGGEEELKNRLSESEYKEAMKQIKQYQDAFGIDCVKKYYSPKRKKAGIIKLLTFNGWFLPARREIAVLSPMESPFQAYRCSRIVLFEPFTGKMRVAEKNGKELISAVRLYVSAGVLAALKLKTASRQYREKRAEITHYDAWKKYLERQK